MSLRSVGSISLLLCATAALASGSGTAPKSPSRQPGKQFNVKDYGAQGNGRGNDTAGIQAALDAARDAGGGRIYLPAGTYLVGPVSDVVFSVASNSEIAGDGPSTIIKIRSGAGKYNAIFYSENAANLSYHDFRVDQNPTGNAATPIGDGNLACPIQNNNYQNLKVQRVRFEPATGAWGVAGLGRKGNQLLVEDCLFDFVNGRVGKSEDEKDYDNSLIYSQGIHQRILNNVFKSKAAEHARTAIEIQGNDVLIQKNQVDYFACGTIVTNSLPQDADPTGPVIIENNQFLHIQGGVDLWASTNRTLRNVKLVSNVFTIAPRANTWAAHGIAHHIYGGPTSAEDPDTYEGDIADVIVSDNTITFLDAPPKYSDNGGQVTAAINFDSVGNASNIQIVKNKINDPPLVGIHLGNPNTKGKLTNVKVEDNVIVNPGWSSTAEAKYRAAVKLEGYLSGIQLSNNTIKRTAARGGGKGIYTISAHPISAENVVLKKNVVDAKDGMVPDLDPSLALQK